MITAIDKDTRMITRNSKYLLLFGVLASALLASHSFASASPCSAALRYHFVACAVSFWTPSPWKYISPKFDWEGTCPCSAALSHHFNDRVQTDLFFIFDRIYVILIDECLKWTIIEELPSKTPEAWFKAAFGCWIRFFGPMKFLVTDQVLNLHLRMELKSPRRATNNRV